MNLELLILGASLLVGFLFFTIGVSVPEYTRLTREIWGRPVPIVGQDLAGWRWANNCFTASGLFTLFGLGLLANLLQEAGSPIFGFVALLLIVIATIFWLAFSAFRKQVTGWAGKRYQEEGDEPILYEPLSAWGGEVGKLYMLLGYLATAALGGAIVQTGFLSAWIGWVSVVLGTVGAVVMLIGRPSPDWADETYAEIPLWLQIVPFIIGVALILQS